jgi:hypothetical protein
MATQQIDGARQVKSGTITNAQIASGAAIASTKLATYTADRDAGGFKITNVAAPVASTDAANKAYVDGVAQGLDVKASCHAASTATVSGTYTATGGTSARGQFTGMPNTIDSVTLAATDRVFLKDQGTPAQNGIWYITTLGSGSNGVWDRATDFDTDAEVTAGAFTFIESGTVNADTGWVLTTDNPIIIGGASGTSLTFAQFSGAGSIVAGAGLTKTGSTIDAVAADNSIQVNADSLQVKIQGATLDVGTGLKVASGGITSTELAASVAGPGLDGGAGTALTISWSGVEIPSGTVDGSNAAFTAVGNIYSAIGNTDPAAVKVFINGALQVPTTHYTRSSNVITMVDAPLTGDNILIEYFKA